MSGVSVTAHGVATAGVLEVYGYSLDPAAGGDTRHIGILLDRAGEYWVLGADATELVNPPSRLVAQVGRLVWVAGTDGIGGLEPSAFGIIREGR